MSWLGLVVAVLKLVNFILDYARQRKLIQQGHDQAIAEVTAEILRKTTAGRAIMEKVNGMSEAEVDAGLRDLEPTDGVSARSR